MGKGGGCEEGRGRPNADERSERVVAGEGEGERVRKAEKVQFAV